MIDPTQLLTQIDRIQALSGLLISWCLKGALILLLAGTASWLLRRGSARTRHLAWALAVVAVTGLPAIQELLPSLPVPAPTPVVAEDSDPVRERVLVLQPTPRPDFAKDCSDTAVAGAGEVPPPAAGPDPEPIVVLEASGLPAKEPPSPAGRDLPLLPLLGFVWVAGATLVLARSVVAWGRRRRLAVLARPAPAEVRAAAQRLLTGLGIRRRVRVLVAPRAIVPMTWGTIAPVILLPSGAADWPGARLRHVLLHELAHVARHDALLFGLARLLCALRWFDPLTWYAARRLRIEAEHACDEHVLAADSRPALYAGHLLESLREARETRPLAAIALARRSQLSERIETILGSAGRRPPTRRGLLLTVLAAAGIVVPLSAITLAAPPQPPPAPEAPPPVEWHFAGEETAPPAPETPAAVPAAAAPVTAAASSPTPPSVAPAARVSTSVPTVMPAPEVPGIPSTGTAGPAPAVEPSPAAPAAATPAPPAPPRPAVATVRTAPEPGSSRRVSVHETGDGRGGYFDRPEYRGACDGSWLGSGKFGHRVNVVDDHWKIAVDHAGCSLAVELRGDVRLGLLDGGVERLGRGAEVSIEEKTREGTRELVATASAGGSPQYRYREDGAEQPLDAEDRAWLERVTTEIFRITGLQAEERVEAILDRSGVDGVLDETDRIGSDHVHRIYLQHLFAIHDPTDAETERALAQAGSAIGSDFDLAELLIALTPELRSPRTQAAYARAAESIGSDFEARRVVEGLTEVRDLDASALATILAVSRNIGSDFEMAEALLAIERRWPADRPLDSAFFAAMDTVGSDFEARRVLQAVASRDLSTTDWDAVARAAEGIGSDFEMAELLVTVARRSPGPLPDAWFRAAGTIGSDFEAQRVLSAAVVDQDLEERELLAVLRAAKSIGSDHELAELLVTVARRYALEGQVRDAYLAAGETVGSSHDRERVLRAAVDR